MQLYVINVYFGFLNFKDISHHFYTVFLSPLDHDFALRMYVNRICTFKVYSYLKSNYPKIKQPKLSPLMNVIN